MALVSGVLVFGSASGEARNQGSCVSTMIEERLFGNDDLDRRASRRLEKLQASIYEGIHRSELLVGRHVDEAKMVLGESEPCYPGQGSDGPDCDIYSVYSVLYGIFLRALYVYADENGIVFKTEIVTL